SQSVKFDAAANVNGQVQMTAQLYTEDGTPYGDEMTFTVKVSELTPTGGDLIEGDALEIAPAPGLEARTFPLEGSDVRLLDEQMLILLAGLVQAKLNIIVSGATGTGKTTLLNALSGLIPDS
ncbi:ATPase, T2SS/T4P/T4SS family, partial [Streptomyces sp. JV184]|uniref:ATPase, T2SS/T4P/T4SS family n=1 Tax=Streptomyces sp. JV184 TaxID=858637 RepID=UPI002E7A44B5